MLIAIYFGIMSLFGGAQSAFGDLTAHHIKEQIKMIVVDERQPLALKKLSVLTDDIDELNKQISKDAEKLEELVNDYNSKPADFDQLFSTTLNKRMQQTTKLISDRKDMLQHITAEEWQAIIQGAKAAAKKKAEN